MSTQLLRAQNIHVRFGSLHAVNNVSFELHAGHLLGLIGPNGAGKTTLLRALCGLQAIASGRIVVMDQHLTPENPDPLQHIGFTPDTPPAYEQLTVRQFLEFVARGYNLAQIDAAERIDFWLEKVWLTEKAEQRIKGLSRGMRQRLGIARTLLANPSVIFLDEPAAGLDPAGRVQFRQLLTSLREQGKALIVSSHILSDMPEYCTHIGIMSAGQMHQFGTVDHVTNLAAHSSHGEGRCRYLLTVLNPPADLASTLAAMPDITDVSVDRHRAMFTYFSAPESAAALLRALLALPDITPTSFAPITPDLEEAYLRTGIKQVD